jgi:hypothetical protein
VFYIHTNTGTFHEEYIAIHQKAAIQNPFGVSK